MPLISRLLIILFAITALAATAHAADGDSLPRRPTKSPAITASFLDGIAPEIATNATSSHVASKVEVKPKRSQPPLPGADPIGRIIALRTGTE
jgi:hypothetical protein